MLDAKSASYHFEAKKKALLASVSSVAQVSWFDAVVSFRCLKMLTCSYVFFNDLQIVQGMIYKEWPEWLCTSLAKNYDC